MKITQISPLREILPEEVKHGDIIKFTSKNPHNGITAEKTGTVQFIVFNPRINTAMFFTEGYRDNYDNADYLLGDGQNTLTYLGHEVSPLDNAEIGDYFEVSQTKYVRDETIMKIEDGWWISRHKLNNKADGRDIYSEGEARRWFRNNDSKLIKANVVKTADGKVVPFSEGDRVFLTPRALEHSAFRGFDGGREYVITRIVGQSVEMYPVDSSGAKYTVHESHLMKADG